MISNGQLDGSQLDYFRRDASACCTSEASRLVEMIRESIPNPDGELRVADLGGGDGRILDGLLDALPNAQGTLVDLAQKMVDANQPHPRKVAIQGDLSSLD